MPAVRNRNFEDLSESGMARKRVLLGKMSTKKKECNENEKVLFSGIFHKKIIKNTKEIPHAHRHFLAVFGVE